MTFNKTWLLRGAAVAAASALFFVSAACGGGSKAATNTTTTTTGSGSSSGSTTTTNSVTVAMDGGPQSNYADAPFVSVTICNPGSTTNCTTLNHILVDTGSSGLRILRSQISSLSLTQENASSGNSLVECAQFMSGYLWGPVKTANVQMAGETAANIPVQVIDDSTAPSFAVPTACSNTGSSMNSQSDLGANGILGVASFKEDCASGTCPASSGFYYGCTSSSCTAVDANTAQQLPNPVAAFSTDNNGVVISILAASAVSSTNAGTMYFGIGTQSNNALPSTAKVLTQTANGTVTTTYASTSVAKSFIDSGSNGYFFLDASTTGIPVCTQKLYTDWYCPTSTKSVSATMAGVDGTTAAVPFNVVNAFNAFNSANSFAIGGLAGPAANTFDWGLPFFFGRPVYTAIENATITNSAGSSFTGPFWAF